MTILKNKNLRKPTKKLIFIISILMIVSLNLLGGEGIEFKYYPYTDKVYHSTLKTEIIPSEYVFITTYSYTNMGYYDEYEYSNLYLYNLKTKEKKLCYVYKYQPYEYSYEKRELKNYVGYITNIKIATNYRELNEYYDIKGNLTTNWTDTNMEAHGFYEITNNRFGETFYNRKYSSIFEDGRTIGITKTNDYIQKLYKYSLTQPEIINKKDRGIYLFSIGDYLCFQNEYYANNNYFEEINYTNGRVFLTECHSTISFSYSSYDSWRKQWLTSVGWSDVSNTIYFQLNNKSLIKPTWQEFANNSLNYIKETGGKYRTNFHFSKRDTEISLNAYKRSIDVVDFLGFIPIEEFEYYLLAD